MRSLLVVTLLGAPWVLGASTARADTEVSADLAAVRSERGVCASDFKGAALASYVRPEVCVRNGTPRKPDDKRGWLFVAIETDGKHDADARAWIVTVKGPKGEVLVDERLAKEPVEKGPCSIEGCHATFVALRTAAWARGSYRFRLVYAEDPEVASQFAITLR